MFSLFSRKAKAAGFVLAVFPLFIQAQEVVERGNQKNPYQPPSWFARMASPETQFAPEIDSFFVPDRSIWTHGRPHVNQKHRIVCGAKRTESGAIEWLYCVI